MIKQRNVNLDIIKGVACIAVILWHCSFPGVYGKFVVYMAKFAVPIFFMVSGYFLFPHSSTNEDKLHILVRKIKHIFVILVGAELLYFFYSLIVGISISYTTKSIIIRIFTGHFYGHQLWFLYALLYSYVLIYIVVKLKIKVHCNYVLIGLIILIIHIVVRTMIRRMDFYDVSIFRNAIMYGLPFILWGYGIRKYKDEAWLKSVMVTNKRNFVIILFLGYFLSIAQYLINKISLDQNFGSVLMSWAIFTFAVGSKNQISCPILQFIGLRLSLYVYIVHVAIIESLKDISDSSFYQWLLPVIVVVCTLAVSYIYYISKKYLKENIFSKVLASNESIS